MDDWAWDDPAELRIRLDVALEHNAMLAAEIAELRERVRLAESPPPSPSGRFSVRADVMPAASEPARDAKQGRIDASAPIEAKIALFRSLFAGRDDVYARRWTSARSGRSGWSPAEADPFDRSLADADRTFFPLTDKVVFDHLSLDPRTSFFRYQKADCGLFSSVTSVFSQVEAPGGRPGGGVSEAFGLWASRVLPLVSRSVGVRCGP